MIELTSLTYRRPDGSLVGIVNGNPYHLLDDAELCPPRLWEQAQALLAALPDELPFEPIPEPVNSVPPSITRRQCAKELHARGLITGPEMVAMTRTGEPPTMVEAILSAMPEADVWDARADFAADTYLRGNPLLGSIMAASGASPSDIDDFFRQAAAK
jgi:hypothetical protein